MSSEEQTERFSQYVLGQPTQPTQDSQDTQEMYAMTMSQSDPNLVRSDCSGCVQLVPKDDNIQQQSFSSDCEDSDYVPTKK